MFIVPILLLLLLLDIESEIEYKKVTGTHAKWT